MAVKGNGLVAMEDHTSLRGKTSDSLVAVQNYFLRQIVTAAQGNTQGEVENLSSQRETS